MTNSDEEALRAQLGETVEDIKADLEKVKSGQATPADFNHMERISRKMKRITQAMVQAEKDAKRPSRPGPNFPGTTQPKEEA